MKAKAQIFLSYARQDEEKVRKLYQKLSSAGFRPWMDKKDILPGEQWKSSIQRAIRRSDFFLMCLSANSVNKRGWIQREIKQALDIWQEMLQDDIYLIPVRLEDCEVPERLGDFQWVNLFEGDGWTRLVKAIQVGMECRAEVPAKEVSEELHDVLELIELLRKLVNSFSPVYEEVRRLRVEGRAPWTIDRATVVSAWELCKRSALSELLAFAQKAKFISSETQEALDSLTHVKQRIDRDIENSNYGMLADSIREFHDLATRYQTEGARRLSEELRA